MTSDTEYAEIKEIQLTDTEYEDGSRAEVTGTLRVSPGTPEYSQYKVYMEITPAVPSEEEKIPEE